MHISLSMDSDLLLDIGNSTISWLHNGIYTSLAIQDFAPDLAPKHQHALVSCVANDKLIAAFKNTKIIQAKPYKNLNFDYDLAQLGTDRFLAIVAGFEQYPGQDLMIIDIGTFVTIDVIKNNQHLSVGIAPGANQLKNIHDFKGSHSKNAWEAGIKNMLIAYIEKHCLAFKGKILITGGGQSLVKISNAQYCQNLVIAGLEIINNQEALLPDETKKL